jgi:hypothetical protein
MPVADGSAGFNCRSGASELNQDDQRRGHRGGRGSMEHDAELTVIRVRGGGVDVSHLHHRQ